MKKSILSVFVTLAMLLSIMPAALADNSSAAYEITPDSYTVAQGDNVTFTFDLKNVELVGNVAAKLSYDPEKLVYVSSERGNIYNYDYVSSTGTLLTHDASKNSIKAMLTFNKDSYHDISNDTLFKVTFMVAADLEPGDYSDYINVEEVAAFRELSQINLKGSVPEITVVKGDAAQPLLVTADKSTVEMGEDVTYTISTPNEIELNALQLLLDYDKTMLSFKDSTLISGDTTNEVNEDGIVWANSEAIKVNGTIATLTFTALKNGTAAITANAESGPTTVKANFPSVNIISDVSVTVTADRKYAAAGDTIKYTVSLDKDASVKALQISLDFSDINIEEAGAKLGGSLEGIEAIANDVAFNNNVATLAFVNDAVTDIAAGTIAEFSFKLASDLAGAYKPFVSDSSVTYDIDGFTADVNVAAVSPTPVTAYMTAAPDVAYVQAGDTVTYTVSIDRKIYPVAFEAHMNIDPKYVDGKVTVKSLNSNIEASYNEQNKDITAVGFNNGSQMEISGDLFTVSFKTKADANTVVTPTFSDIVVSGASVSAAATPFTIFAEGAATVNISSSSEYALPGGTVTYTFDLKDAKALKILNIDLGYDPAKYVDATVKVGDVAPLKAETNVDKTGGTINVLMMGESALSGTKNAIVTVEFKVADDPAVGPDGVSIDVKSDEFTKLTVKNNAKTSIVSSFGHLTVNTDKTYVFNAPSAEIVEVTVTAENTTDLADLSFELTYDKSKFMKISEIETNTGAEVNVIEEGKIRYVVTGADLDGDTELMKFRLYPIESASGYTDIAASEVATTGALDSVKASKRIYLYSMTETNQIITVRNAIANIGDITVSNYKDKASAVQTARALYDNLSPVQKLKLSDELKTLEAAEKAIADYKEQEAKAGAAVDALIDAIGDVTESNFLTKGDAIKAAEDAYAALTDAQRAYVTKYETLKKARELYDGFFAALKNFKVTLAKNAEGYAVSIVNQKSVSDDPVVVLAVYSDGVLVSTKAVKASEAASISAAADTANTTAAVYVWNSLNDMTPYTNVEIVK